MPATATYVPFARVDPDERAKVVQWRVEQLIAAVFDPRVARVLAERDDVDLHTATDLLEAGCPPLLAERILL